MTSCIMARKERLKEKMEEMQWSRLMVENTL